MSEKERDDERHGKSETEEPVQDPTSDEDFVAHSHGERGRDDSSGLPNRDGDGERDRDGDGERHRDSQD